MRITTDYLVIGAGASGLAFTDTLVAHADVDVVLVDRNDAPGGHWVHAYPFVVLHSPSAFYGVDSLRLGEDRVDESGPWEAPMCVPGLGQGFRLSRGGLPVMLVGARTTRINDTNVVRVEIPQRIILTRPDRAMRRRRPRDPPARWSAPEAHDCFTPESGRDESLGADACWSSVAAARGAAPRVRQPRDCESRGHVALETCAVVQNERGRVSARFAGPT